MNTERIGGAAPVQAGIRRAAVQHPDAALSTALLKNHDRLTQELASGVAHWPKYADRFAQGYDRETFQKNEIHALVDYLALYFRHGDKTFKHLYIGEKLKQLYHVGDDRASKQNRARAMFAHDEQAYFKVLEPELTAEQRARLERELGDIARVILSDARSELEVLAVGDCLFLDIQAFLPARCVEDGIAVNFTFASSKNGPSLRNDLKSLSSRKFDLVIYSPFTYEFSPTLAQFFRVRKGLAGPHRIRAAVDEAMSDVEATLNVLAARFECPVFVHNTVNIHRHDSSIRQRLCGIATRRARRIARDLVNARVVSAIAQRNAMSFEHLFLIDETRLLADRSDLELGRKFFDSELQHPAVLGLALSEAYADLIAAHVSLLGRKLVVCDLDNTLWDGVIGEGAVTHFLDRQRILKQLRAKGIVLAINSKNDPANVHWNGGLLTEADFVEQQINWDSKITNMKRIRENLNLKYKDYVFIDDRGDQLELIGSALPEIRLLDATSERSWRLLEAWAAMLPEQTEGDRTQLYHERQARESFVSEIGEEDQATLFNSLGIRVTLRKAVRSDLQRVTELINRTNQFNLAGSRTTFGEISRWHDDPSTTLIVVEAADKFGQMGLISTAVVRREADALAIPIFVLSCRVFGYGIETVILNAVKRLAREREIAPEPIRGAYLETSHNAPCKSMYPDHGFTWDGAAWIFEGGDPTPDPAWLTVDDRIAPARPQATSSH